jgi:hypothetical protein
MAVSSIAMDRVMATRMKMSKIAIAAPRAPAAGL